MTSGLVSVLVAAIVGAALAVGTVITGTSIIANDTPPAVEKPIFEYGER